MKCPYCGGKVNLVPSKVIYHNGKVKEKMWVCENYPKCDAYVGCHPGTEIPLGRPANKKLRNLKMEAVWNFSTFKKSKNDSRLEIMMG